MVKGLTKTSHIDLIPVENLVYHVLTQYFTAQKLLLFVVVVVLRYEDDDYQGGALFPLFFLSTPISHFFFRFL